MDSIRQSADEIQMKEYNKNSENLKKQQLVMKNEQMKLSER